MSLKAGELPEQESFRSQAARDTSWFGKFFMIIAILLRPKATLREQSRYAIDRRSRYANALEIRPSFWLSIS
ncbi:MULTISPECIES: hypothetical protein [Moorena]|uniref:hypothetical protein n=1 Tax=Moorena TaxID=1155738 RepID=UPI0005CB68EE|nr:MULTISPECIES: hypothetical protein [Moorena]NEP30273.1 hypothetical protein [Moorena sp. SIO3B2]NEQ06227.1 hypothetical protein [Moorena sp. SIO4E2]NER88498.1 hypothetical protein [Moorena sp. SIO3A2]NES46317.1 hypothetical protein [Moorena sp. SIO2C4]OLT66855.1 hypothetical protein BI334_19245 [Moorena producens 3L]